MYLIFDLLLSTKIVLFTYSLKKKAHQINISTTRFYRELGVLILDKLFNRLSLERNTGLPKAIYWTYYSRNI